MRRGGWRSAAAYQHPQARGLSCHLHANSVRRRGEQGRDRGPRPRCKLRRIFEGATARHTQTLGVEKPSAGPHLVQPASPFTHCLIRRVCWTLLLVLLLLLLLFFSGTQTLPGLFSNTNQPVLFPELLVLCTWFWS